jgi:hypothetical protein
MIENDVSFLILCPELNVGGLKSTASSIKCNFPNSPRICMVGSNANEVDLAELGKYCPVHKGGGTILSLINEGVMKFSTRWCFVLMAGCMVRSSLFKKYDIFLKSDKDVLYSAVGVDHWLFPDATINGMLLSKGMLEDVGLFPDSGLSIADSKVWWSILAADKGYVFKAIVGTKL